LYCFPAQIHKRLRLCQRDLASGNGTVCDERLRLFLSKGKPMRGGNGLNATEADVVPRVFIFTARIAQANNQITIRHALFPVIAQLVHHAPDDRAQPRMNGNVHTKDDKQADSDIDTVAKRRLERV